MKTKILNLLDELNKGQTIPDPTVQIYKNNKIFRPINMDNIYNEKTFNDIVSEKLKTILILMTNNNNHNNNVYIYIICINVYIVNNLSYQYIR
jgi:hypothetical protein